MSSFLYLLWLLFIGIYGLSAEEANSTCSSCHTHRLYGTKTTYMDALGNINSGANITIPSSCQPVMLYLFKRHAIRYPDGEDIPEMEQVLQEIKQKAIAAYADGKSGLCEKDVARLQNWRINMKAEDDNLITTTGLKETETIAKRLQQRFPTLLDPRKDFDVAISNRIRTNQTAYSFIREIYSNTDAPIRFSPIVNLEWTDFHSICKGHLKEQGVDLKKPMPYQDLLKSKTFDDLRKAVSDRLGLDKKVSQSELKIMFRGCAFGHAIFNESAWCSVFTSPELRLIELLEDVDDYYGDAYGRDINQRAPCSVVRDLVHRLEESVRKQSESGMNQDPGSAATTFLRFSHAGAIKQLISFFGLFDQLNANLTASCEHESEKWNSRSRDWRSSLLSPFSSNFQFVLYRCNESSTIDYRLLTLLQEAPVVVKGCTSEFCLLDQFLTEYRPALQCNLKKFCRI